MHRFLSAGRRPVLALRLRLLLLTLLLAAMPSLPVAAQEEERAGMRALTSHVGALLARSCATAGCHAGPAPQMALDLSPGAFPASVLGQPSTERPELMRVHPGRPDSSYLLMKVKGAPDIIGAPMPFTGDRLSDEEIDTIAAWIAGVDEDAASTLEAQSADREAYPFHGWKVINLPTSRVVDAGSWLFLISHRFNPSVNSRYDAFFGLDGSAIMYLSMGYAVTDDLLVALGRSNAADDVELQLRYQLREQRVPRGWPVGIAVQTAVNWISEPPPGGPRLRGEAFKLTGQLSLTRALTPRLGVAVVPGILLNPAEGVPGEDALVTVGVGGRWNFRGNLALVAEWVPIVSGYTRTSVFGNDLRFDSWGGGLEISVGGHVFQIVASNAVGLATDQYLRGGDLDIRDLPRGDVRLGFNIFRILNF